MKDNMEIKEAFSPTGARIIGTVEKVEGVASADVAYEDGKLVVKYLGETNIDWNGQTTVMSDNGEGRLFEDENGVRWCEDSLESATDVWPPKKIKQTEENLWPDVLIGDCISKRK